MYSVDDDADPGNCTKFNRRDLEAIFISKLSLCIIAILTNLLVVGFIFYSKKTKDFMYRLILYLLITNIIQAIAIIWIALPVDGDSDDRVILRGQNSTGWRDACAVGGFFSMASLWMGNIIVIWIVLYLLWLGWNLYRHVFRRRQSENISDVSHIGNLQQRCSLGEIIGVFVLYILPFVIAAFPFAIKGGMYGVSGPWCWVKQFNVYCGDLSYTPLVVEMVFFYGPLIVVMFAAVVFVCIALICCCRGEVRRHDKIPALKERRVKEIAVVLACPLLYCAIIVLLLINRIIFGVNQDGHKEADPSLSPYRELWITHSVADPLRVLLPAIAILVNPFVWKDANACCKSSLRQRNVQEKRRLRRSFRRRNYDGVDNKAYVESLVVSGSNTSLDSKPM